MASRPSRTTRSSTAASASAPVTRATRTTATSGATFESTSTSQPPRRTTRSSRAATPATDSNPPSRPTSRASTQARTSAVPAAKPLWNSSRNNVQSTANDAAKRTSLAVPKSRTGAGGLLRKMTSRDSIRPGPPPPQTPARSSIPVPSTPAAYRESTLGTFEESREPIKAYLRIRPPGPGVSAESYMQVIGDNQVLMVPPSDHRLNPSSSSSSLFSNALLRSSNLNLNPASHPSGTPDDLLALPQGPDPSTFGTYYKFTSVFAPSSPVPSSTTPTSPNFPPSSASSQSDFFRSTTLPLVQDFLENGENCLLFAYGPSGSGKTYTVQGGSGDEAGLLPRVMDVVWRSLKGKEPKGEGNSSAENDFKRHLYGGPGSSTPPGGATPMGKKPVARGLGVKESLPMSNLPDVVPVDDKYEYSIWVSYSEIYNEKIYDLLESPIPAPAPSTSASIASTSNNAGGMFSGFSQGAKNLFKFPTVKRSALSLKADKATTPSSSGAGMGQAFKVVAGMKEIRVHSAEEAQSVLSRGQANRRVFSTLANRVSSRSHSVFTIKVHRTLRASTVEGFSERISKFSIVDLAGSERVVNTQTTGDRLKEAGNINKSLMVLGQCMEVLRKNQEREKGRKPAIVPFRHSKLTEMFQSFFIGDGKAVMIVNVNPYETGYDENTHVMKFSAVAKGVMTVKKDQTHLVVPVLPPINAAEKPVKRKSEPRVVRVSLVEGAEEEEVIYQEEDCEEDDDAEEDEFVNALLDELSTLRTALYESQMATLLAESTARARTVREYELKMLEMERKYQDRLREEAIESELKLNAKLDILTRLQAAKTPRRGPSISPSSDLTLSPNYDDSDDEDRDEDEGEGTETDTGVDRSVEDEGDGEEEEGEGDSGEVEQMLLADHGDQARDSMSPLATRVAVHLKVTSPRQAPRSSLLRHGSPSPAREDADEEEEDEDDELQRSNERSRESVSTEDHDETANSIDEEQDVDTINTVSDISADEVTYGSLASFVDGRLSVATDRTYAEETSADTTECTEENSDEEEDGDPDQEEEEAPEADDELESPPQTIRSVKTVVLPEYATPSHLEKENVVPTKMEDGPNRDGDEFGYDEDKSLIIESGSKSGKKKRNLGAKRTFDAEAIDMAAESTVTPMRNATSSRSIF